MLMGPVFRAELLRSARQRHYYALRLVYGLILLLMVWVNFERMRQERRVARLADVAAFATRTFESFAVVQLIAVLLLVPPVFGGAIADEKQRKTLHYLMASQLSSGEIMLDKVLGRSVHLAVFIAIGLPVVSLLGLFGGISAESVLAVYAGTFSTVAFAIAMTVLISTRARRVRDAIVSAYLLIPAWLFVPPLILLFGTVFGPGMYLWIKPVNDWLVDTSPFGVWLRWKFLINLGLSASSMFDQLLWMVGAQLVGALVLLLIAVWRLRPTFRRQEESPVRRARSQGSRRRPRWFARPECGDAPVFWKERHFAATDRFTRLVLLPVIAVITMPLVVMTDANDGRRVLMNFWRPGYAGLRPRPEGFLWALQVDLGWYVAFWLLAVAGASAASMAIEREQDTWTSLTATPLTGREILRGKVLGALWHQRGFAVVLVVLWTLGLITGTVHPLGILASVALVALLTWFVANLGVYFGLRASGTSQAMAATLLILACFNGNPLLVFFWFVGAMGWESSYSLLGAMPTMAAHAMISPESLAGAWTTLTTRAWIPPIMIFLGGMILAIVCIYAGAALALERRIIGELDRWLDLPPPPRMPATGVAPARDLEEVAAR
jgi:ABC-type transport system involved in multi-copper enzyme maturation permease subunit